MSVNTSFASLITDSDEDVEATNACSVHLTKLRAYDYDINQCVQLDQI